MNAVVAKELHGESVDHKSLESDINGGLRLNSTSCFISKLTMRSLSVFQRGRRAHPHPLVRRLPAEERDGQAGVEAGHLRRPPDRLAPPHLGVGLCRGGLGRRVGRHHQPRPRRLRQGEAQRERRRQREEEGEFLSLSVCLSARSL